jgi:hypothetical protein
MSTHGEVLVVIINNQADWEIVCTQHWYRIPIAQVDKLKQRNAWHPKWLAFYQTKEFATAAHTVTYYAEVQVIAEVERWELFPDEPKTVNSEKRYAKLELSCLQQLSEPIVSKRLRRITFIPTTWEKLTQAQEINDLWNDEEVDC